MVNDVIIFGKRAVPIENCGRKAGTRQRFDKRVREMAYDLEFRRHWKRTSRVELWSDAAILKLEDGSKYYLNIS
jgi:hypothetical protein